MKVYLARLELHGPLFFSSETKHALSPSASSHLLVAPKAVLSPIPLTYALNGLPSEAYAWRKDKGPSYEALRSAKALSYGALPIKVRYKRFFFAMRGMSWGEYRGNPKVNLPRMVTMVAIVPPSSFRTAVVSERPLPSAKYLRIGVKRSGIMLAKLEEAEIKETSEKRLTLPATTGMLEMMGCKVKSFVSLLHEFSGEEVGLAEVEGCEVVEACAGQRCERLALPST